MSGYTERKRGMDSMLAYDSELRFKITNRRNQLLGEWVAEQLGYYNGAAQRYAKSVVLSDFDEPGDDDVLRKVLSDLHRAGVDLTVDQLRNQMGALLEQAEKQIREET